MRIERFDPTSGSREEWLAFNRFWNIITAEYWAEDPPAPVERTILDYTNQPSFTTRYVYAAWDADGQIVGVSEAWVPHTEDNQHLAYCDLAVLPEWRGQGLDFDYLLGRDISRFPANSFVMRRADFEDATRTSLYESYLRAWAMGLEFGHQNPRAATHIVMTRFPGLQLKPDIATESMMELASVFRGDFAKRQGWGWHDLDSWRLFLKTVRDIGQITVDLKTEDVIKNDFVAAANRLDAARVKADADAYELPDDYKAVDVEAIHVRL